MPPDFFHPDFYLVTASFSNGQLTIISQSTKPVGVDQKSCLEGLCSREGWGWSLGWGHWAGSKWDFWSWRDFCPGGIPGTAPACCPPAEELHGPRLGWELSQHIQEEQRVYLAPSSDLKGFVEFVWEKKTQLDELNPLWPSGAPETSSWTHTGQAERARERFSLRNYLSAYCSHECFMKPLIPSDFSCLENIDHGFG